MTKKLRFLILFFLLLPIIINAQATSSSQLAWNEVAPDLPTAQSYVYSYFPDNATTGIVLANVTCTGTASPFSCTVQFPSFTAGMHTLTLSASDTAGVSAQSSPFPFSMVVIPAAPSNISIK